LQRVAYPCDNLLNRAGLETLIREGVFDVWQGIAQGVNDECVDPRQFFNGHVFVEGFLHGGVVSHL
jgi:hypothetical protein